MTASDKDLREAWIVADKIGLTGPINIEYISTAIAAARAEGAQSHNAYHKVLSCEAAWERYAETVTNRGALTGEKQGFIEGYYSAHTESKKTRKAALEEAAAICMGTQDEVAHWAVAREILSLIDKVPG